MSDPDVSNVSVRYRDAEPDRVEVETSRWSSDYCYRQTYTFTMEGSTAVLVAVEGDGDSYPVRANAGTRAEAADAVDDLPFVQAVSMFDGGAE